MKSLRGFQKNPSRGGGLEAQEEKRLFLCANFYLARKSTGFPRGQSKEPFERRGAILFMLKRPAPRPTRGGGSLLLTSGKKWFVLVFWGVGVGLCGWGGGGGGGGGGVFGGGVCFFGVGGGGKGKEATDLARSHKGLTEKRETQRKSSNSGERGAIAGHL